MADGEFEYTLKMPKPEDYNTESLDIKFSEDGVNFEDLTNEVNEDNFVITDGLDHFTTFIVVRNPSPPPVSNLEMVIDNTDLEFTIIDNPNWLVETTISGFYGTNYRILRNETGRVQYSYQVLDTGNYDIYAWYPSDATLGTADYIVYHTDETTIPVDQTQNGGQWNLLGNFHFLSGVRYYIVISNTNSEIIVADAVRIRSTEAPSHVWVDDDWTGHADSTDEGAGRYFGYNAFAEIQDAIDAVRPDGIVDVLAGTYEEQIDIQKELTLQGEDRTLVTINSPVNLNPILPGNYPIVYITGVNNVVIDNITINGLGRGNSNNRFFGVEFRYAGGTIQNCNIIDIREDPFPLTATSNGISIYVYNIDQGVRNININNNQISNYQKTGIVVRGNFNINVNNNIIIGPEITTLIDTPNGLDLNRGVTGIISGNLIRGNLGGPSNSAVGILLRNEILTGLVVTNNEIFNNEVGLWNLGDPITPAQPITAYHNYFHNNDFNAVDDQSTSAWDNGTEGNRWDDYYGVDLNGDGVGNTQTPYIIRDQNGDPSTSDRFPLTDNYLTAPSIETPLNGDYCSSQTCPIINWTDSDGTFPSFSYRIQGFSDAGYADLIWDPGWISASEISTANIPNRTIYIRVQSQDASGNISYWSNGISNPYSITIDNIPPVTDNPLISPQSGSYWNVPIFIHSISTEIIGSGIDYVDIYFRNSGTGEPWTLIITSPDEHTLDPTDNPNIYIWNFDWTPNLEGLYDIRAQAADTAGNIESSGYAYNVRYDVTEPIVDITNPLNNAVVGGTIIIEGNINEAYLDRYELTIDSTSIGTGTINNVSHDFDTTTLTDGDYSA